MIRIALFQFAPQQRSLKGNLDYICKRLAATVDSLVVLPELFLSSYMEYEYIPSSAIKETLQPLIKLGKKNTLAFVGSIPVRTKSAAHNRGIYMDSGVIFSKDKVRLFGQENDTMTPGTTSPLFLYKGIPFSLQICLDVTNPVPTFRAAQRGAKIIINPATVSVDYLRTINKARALENNIPVVFCNRSGIEKNGTHYLGQSAVFFPDGTEKTIIKSEDILSFCL